MIEINETLIFEKHIIRVKRIENTLRIYTTATAKDKIRYKEITKSKDEITRYFRRFLSSNFVKVSEDEILNKDHIIEIESKIEDSTATYQLKITTTENIEKDKQKYDVYSFYSQHSVRSKLAELTNVR